MPDLFQNGSLPQWVAQWTPILLDTALKGIVILALATAGVLFMRRATAALRHLVWLTAVIALLCLPALSVLMPGWNVLPNWFESVSPSIQVLPMSSSSALPATDISRGADMLTTAPPEESAHQAASVPRRQGALPDSGSHAEAMLPGVDTPLADDVAAEHRLVTVGFWLLATWAAGALVFSVVTCLGLLSLGRLETNAQHVTEQLWRSQVERLSRELGLRRPVCILLSRQQNMPMVWGLFGIKVLLPEAAAHWASDRRRFVLLHELAHARRWDYLTHLLTRLVCAFHWFNPLIWVAARRMAIERERACDDLVLNSGLEPADYAEELLQVVAGLRCPTSLGAAAIAMAHPSKLESRLKAILDATISRRRLTRVGVGACLLAAICLVLPLASLRPMATGNTVSGARTVRFPEKQSLGRAYAGEVRPLDPHWWMDWEYLGPAQGEIVVPAGQALRLTVSGTGLSHLPFLSTLAPGDLQVIDFSVRVSDAHLAQLTVLKGLEMLVSHSPTLGDEGLKSISQLASLVSLVVQQGAYTDRGLGHVQNLKSLQRLDLGPKITDVGLAQLRGMNALRSIDLARNAHITDVGLTHLADLPALESLTLDRLKITGSCFASFQQHDSLRKLRLNFSEITDAGLVYVGKLRSLETLSLFSTKITDEGIMHLQGLGALRELDLGSTSVSDESAQALSKLTSLESLDLARWNTDAIFEGLKSLRHIKHLDASTIKLIGEGLESLRSFEALESLKLPKGVDDFSFLRSLPRLERLLIQRARLTSDLSDHLATLRSLKRLSLSEFEVVDEDYAWLGNLKDLEELTWWAYGQEQTGDMGDGILKAISSHERPSILDLRGVKATQDGFRHLLGLTTLRELTISIPGITDASMSSLAQASSLKRLILSADTISANGMKYLADLKSLQELQLYVPEGDMEALLPLADSNSLGSIRISGFAIDPDSPQHLKAIAHHRLLTLAGSSISDQDKTRIEQQVPNCRISRGARVLSLPAPAAPKPKPYPSLVGKPLPDLQAFGIEANRDPARSILVCFFDMQQRPSRSYIRQLGARAQDLVIVAVQTEDVGEAVLRDWVEQRSIPFPVGRITGDAESIRRQWGVRALPWLVLAGPDHVVRAEGFTLDQLDKKVSQYVKKTAAQSRVLHFPQDRSLGMVLTVDRNVLNSTSYDDWEPLGEATGRLTVPQGKAVRLDVSREACKDLSPLSALAPNDLHMIFCRRPEFADDALVHMSHLTGLHELYLRDTGLLGTGLKHLARLKSLKRLRVDNTHVGDDELAYLVDLPALESLNLARTPTSDAGMIHVGRIVSLRELILGQGVGDEGLSHLKGLVGLRYLLLDGQAITEAGLVHLDGMTQMETLWLDGAQVSDRGLVHLQGMKSIKRLCLYRTRVTEKGLMHLGGLQTLEDLFLSFSVADTGLQYLAKLGALKGVGIDGDSVTASGLLALSKMKSLEDIGIHSERDPEAIVKQLAGLPHLTRLALPRGTRDKTIAQLKKLTMLQELSLNGGQITSRGMAILIQLPSLQSLRLTHMKLSDEDWRTLGRISSLQRLDVNIRSEITNAHIERLTGLQSLKRLYIDCSSLDMHITDEGLAYIAKLTSLERLTLHGAKITDKGLQHLEDLSSLKWMDLQGCKVTDQGLERLKQKLPALHWYL